MFYLKKIYSKVKNIILNVSWVTESEFYLEKMFMWKNF